MKVLDIALKDMLRFFRSLFALVMMFLAPLLITGLIYFAFGNLSGDGDGFNLPVTRVQVVNLDQPVSQSGGFAAGQVLVEFLQSERLTDILLVTEGVNTDDAFTAVDHQKVDVAVIIPGDFTTVTFAHGGSATVTLYQDPTLTLGPGIVKGLISQFVDGFAGAKIAAGVVAGQLSKRGVEADAAMMQDVASKYALWAEGPGQGEGGNLLLDIKNPPGAAEPVDSGAHILGPVMAGMMIFFVFFTGASTAESIIREDEEGTLSRLFTTPTPLATILGGKFASAFVMLIVQLVVLVVISGIVFSIQWGHPLTIALAALGTVVIAAGFGVMIMSFIKSTRQSGPVMGVVLTISGMAGGLMTTGFQDVPPLFDYLSLITPHGWALRGWKIALDGGGVGDLLSTLTITLTLGIVFFGIGVFGFRKRYA